MKYIMSVCIKKLGGPMLPTLNTSLNLMFLKTYTISLPVSFSNDHEIYRHK